MRRPFLYLALIFLLGIGIGLVVNFRHGRPAASEHANTANVPDVAADNVLLIQGSEGKELWRVRAKRVQYKGTKHIVAVIEPQLLAYVGPEREKAFIRADSGEIDQAGDALTLRDNVKGHFEEFSLISDAFDYIGAMKKAYFKGRVKVSRPDFEVNATTVELDLNTRELTAAGGVSAEFVPESLGSSMKGKRP